MEIYNEQCRDLLKRKTKNEVPQSLKVREHPKEGPFVQGKYLELSVKLTGILYQIIIF